MRKRTFAMLATALALLSMIAGAAAFTFGTPTATEAPPAMPGAEADAWAHPIPREILEDPLDLLRLVNKEFLLDKTYPDESTLVKVTVRKVSGNEMKLRGVASEALSAMFDEAAADGVTLYLHNGYRDYQTQSVMYYNRLKANNGKDDGVVQKEGASDHQTGLGADVISKEWIGSKFNAQFAKTKEAQWMAANGSRFGFIIRYPEGKEHITDIMYEPWHLRYVGAEAARYITEKGYTLEEFTQERMAALRGAWTPPDTETGAAMGESEEEIAYEVDSFSF